MVRKNEYRHDEIPVYVVKAGDKIRSIASATLGGEDRFRDIMKMNGLKDETVHEGQILKLPKE